MNRYLLPFLFLFSLNTFAQQTNIAIEGFFVFKIGDTITHVNNYGYDFREIFIDNEYNLSEKNQSQKRKNQMS